MSRLTFSFRFCVLSALALAPISAADASPSKDPAPQAISGQDVNGHAVALNGTGHYTLVMYTNPDIEDTSRKVTLALDPYRSRSNFTLVRVVDLRGGVPPEMRGIVRVQIRKELVKEAVRLKKAGVNTAAHQGPIIPDFSGSTLDALGWDSTYDAVRVVVYDPKGHEIKRLVDVNDPKAVKKVVADIL